MTKRIRETFCSNCPISRISSVRHARQELRQYARKMYLIPIKPFPLTGRPSYPKFQILIQPPGHSLLGSVAGKRSRQASLRLGKPSLQTSIANRVSTPASSKIRFRGPRKDEPNRQIVGYSYGYGNNATNL